MGPARAVSLPHMPHPTDQTFDEHMMSIAIAMARRGLGRTAPNPSVGAVIVDPATGEVIARGWTQPGGRPHAETEAIARAGGRTRGMTLYVTLEPCSHYGKTPPCAEAIIKAGFTRVVCAVLDPDPRVSGRGIRMLRAAGIEVTRGVCATEAHRVTRGHIQRVTERRPLIQLKLALGSDGEVHRGDGKPVWVTGLAARAHGHLLRARADAIMAGSGTLRDDDPELTCRLPGLADRTPIRVALAGRNLPAATSKIVTTASQAPSWIFTSEPHGEGSSPSVRHARAAIAASGARVFDVTAVDERPWLPAVLEKLVEEGITRLLVEGGPTLWRAFLDAGLADEIFMYQPIDPSVPVDVAARRAEAILTRYGARPESHFALAATREIAPDRLYVFRRA